MTRALLRRGAVIAIAVMPAVRASAQTNLQLWGNFTMDWVTSDRVTYGLDFEPKVLLVKPEADPGWRAIDISPSFEYALKNWLDLNAEGDVGVTKQTDDVDSLELTARLGARFHLLSRENPTVFNFRHERPPRRRVVLRDLVRVEFRNFHYSDDTPSSSNIRFRNRIEFLAPLNKAKLTDDGVRYFIADWEVYVPLDDAAERFANKTRVRTGIGYRQTFAWRYQLLYMWTRSRNTIEEGFKTADNIIDLQVKRVF